MSIFSKMFGVRISLDELRKDEVQDWLAELCDKTFIFEKTIGRRLEKKDKALFKELIKSLVGRVSKLDL